MVILATLACYTQVTPKQLHNMPEVLHPRHTFLERQCDGYRSQAGWEEHHWATTLPPALHTRGWEQLGSNNSTRNKSSVHAVVNTHLHGAAKIVQETTDGTCACLVCTPDMATGCQAPVAVQHFLQAHINW